MACLEMPSLMWKPPMNLTLEISLKGQSVVYSQNFLNTNRFPFHSILAQSSKKKENDVICIKCFFFFVFCYAVSWSGNVILEYN